ncbi:MAG: methyltransferase [Limisphaerales bacterium]
MPIPAHPPGTDPAQILRYRDRQYAAELIATALLHFDFFTWLYDFDEADNAAIAQEFGFAERPLDVLLTLCRANGFISTRDGRHSLSSSGSEHLVKSSPWFLGPYYEPIRDTPIVEAYLKVLATGKPANWQAKDDGNDWHESMLSEGFAQSFTALMNCRGMAFGQTLAAKTAPLIGERTRLLDVGGGSGIYAGTMSTAIPQLQGTVLEQSPVDSIARMEIESHGLSDRIEVVTADMFNDTWPETDVVLLSNVLHDWDFPEVRALLEKAAAALDSDGLVIIHEAFLHDNKTGPLPVAEYSALLMNITQGKCYTPREYGEILEELGFKVGPYVDTIADRGFMTALKR